MRRLIVLLGAIALMMAGCSSIEEDLCEAKCACEGCSDGKYTECLQEYDADRAAADYRDCFHLYDDLQDCRDATGFCVDNDWKDACKPEKEAYKHCVDGK